MPVDRGRGVDWSDTYGAEQRVGLVHACSIAVGLTLYAASLIARRRGNRARGKLLGLAGMASITVGGYLGGYLSYSRGVGVNYAFYEYEPDDWTPVIDEGALPEAKATKVDAGGATVLLYRDGERILAVGSRCSHAGGPLEEGTIDPVRCTVECPWHHSVFRLGDGSVVHGLASIPQAAYDTRVREGKVEVRSRAG